MNRQSAGNQIIETYIKTKSTLKVAKELNISYNEARKHLINQGFLNKNKKPVKTTGLIKNYFEIIDNANKAYLLGFLKADGYIDKTRMRCVLSVQEKDKEILEKFCDLIKISRNKINKYEDLRSKSRQNSVILSIYDKDFVTHLLDLKNNSILEKVPEDYCYDFIRGYFDGNGTIAYRNKEKLYFSVAVSGSPNDDSMMKYILHRIQGFTNIYNDKRSNLPFIKTDNKNVIKLFRDLVYKNASLYLTRKKIKFDEFSMLFESSTTKRKNSLNKE